MHDTQTLPTQRRTFIRPVCRLALAFALGSTSFIACTPAEPEVEPTPIPSVENARLGLRLAEVPAAFEVHENADDRLVLTTTDPERRGTIEFLVLEQSQGVNLLAAIDSHKTTITEQLEGTYSGAQELVGPFGTAFYSRGQYPDNGGRTEETRVFSILPSAQDMLILVYRYPAGEDSSQRVTELLEVFARVETMAVSST